VRIDKRLNFVIPIERDDGNFYVHSAPIPRAVYEKYFLVISKTFAAIYTQGLSFVAGPRIASMMVKEIATELGTWDGPEGVEQGLMAEITRLSNIMAPSSDGWKLIPFQTALDRDMLDEEEVSEVINALTFFTVAWHMHRHREREAILTSAAQLWGGQLTSSNTMDFMNSLPTLTSEELIGPSAPNVKALSIPV
jgi:hypothetical protein